MTEDEHRRRHLAIAAWANDLWGTYLAETERGADVVDRSPSGEMLTSWKYEDGHVTCTASVWLPNAPHDVQPAP